MAAVETVRPQGDRVANTTHDLYRQYGRQIYAYCFHKLHSREEAEDAVQTTFMNAFRSLQRGTSTQFEQAWLYKIAQNVCFERSSSSSRRRLHEAPNDFETLQEIVPAANPDGSLELIGIEEALEGMPENQRRAILLREWQGLSYREIAEELGLSQAAVEMLIFRARRALAGALEQPDEARAKRRRVGRGITVGGLLSALKTLFGGGVAVKAVAAAAAAVVVVGESAQYTVVQHAKVGRGRLSSAAASVSARAAVKAPTVASVAQVGVPDRAEPSVVSTPRAPRAHTTHSKARAAPTARSPRAHGQNVVRPAVQPKVEAAPPAPVVSAPTPAPAPAPETVPAPATPPAPVVKQVAAAPAPEPPVTVPTATLPTLAAQPADQPPAPADPGNGNGNAWGRDKDHGKNPDPPAVTATAEPAPAPVSMVPAFEAPASPEHGNGKGNGNGHGKP